MRARRGGYAIEFALTLPLWFAVVVAAIEYGWWLRHQSAVDLAATEGCRVGVLLDPGESGQYEAALKARVDTTSREALSRVLGGTACEAGGCKTVQRFSGTAPQRMLTCEVDLRVDPLLGVVMAPAWISAERIGRLEWQRTGGAER